MSVNNIWGGGGGGGGELGEGLVHACFTIKVKKNEGSRQQN